MGHEIDNSDWNFLVHGLLLYTLILSDIIQENFFSILQFRMTYNNGHKP